MQNLRKCLQHVGDLQQEQSERQIIRRDKNMERGSRWSITYFLGYPSARSTWGCNRKDWGYNREEKTHLLLILQKLLSGGWG